MFSFFPFVKQCLKSCSDPFRKLEIFLNWTNCLAEWSPNLRLIFVSCPAMAMVVLEARNLGRIDPAGNGIRPLLRDVSFRLGSGQVLAVVGRSGAGKTTLLRLLNRLDEATHGEVLVHGRDYREFAPTELRRRIGMIMQRPYLFPGSVAMNVRYGPEQHGTVLSTTQIEELLYNVGMPDYSGRDISMLSGGESQRISIARALANAPEVLLLDEPTSALDPDAKRGVERLLMQLVRERHIACVWVTHDLEQAERVAELAMRMEAGQTVALGTPRELNHA